jgi:hypothetical protein
MMRDQNASSSPICIKSTAHKYLQRQRRAGGAIPQALAVADDGVVGGEGGENVAELLMPFVGLKALVVAKRARDVL